jgi:hypothetical protein
VADFPSRLVVILDGHAGCSVIDKDMGSG